jgi:ribosomal protein S18 acetylase RimI-like enzyme
MSAFGRDERHQGLGLGSAQWHHLVAGTGNDNLVPEIAFYQSQGSSREPEADK